MSLLSNTLENWRRLRDRFPALRVLHNTLRGPWYRALEALYTRGVATTLCNGQSVMVHPRLLGMQPDVYEPEIVAELARHIKPGMTVFDIGAHVGLHTLMFSKCVGPGGRVIAVEASPANAALLRRHLEWNDCKNVEVVHAAIGDREGAVSFSYRPDPTDAGGFANSLAYDIKGETATVRMTTIDSLSKKDPPTLIKIDVEGAEMLALRGAQRTLEQSSAVLLIAVHPNPIRLMGGTPAELLEFMTARHYEGRHLDGRPAIELGFEEIVFQKVSIPK